MLPVFQIGPFALPVPGISLLLAFWLGLSLAEKRLPLAGPTADNLYNLVFTGLVTGLFGARLGYVFQFPNAFIQSPISFLSLNSGLFDPFTGFVFLLLGMFIFGQRARLSFFETLDTLTPMLAVLAIGLAISHIASGESFGSLTNLPWGIYLWGAKRHPTQFYELFAASIIFILMTLRLVPKFPAGHQFFMFSALTAVSRLFLETYHGDSPTIMDGLRIKQIIAWIVLSVALYSLDKLQRKNFIAKGNDNG